MVKHLRLRAGVLLALALLPSARPARALTLLTAGKVAAFRSAPGRAPSAVLHVQGDRGLRSPGSPTCPATSSLRFALSRRAADFEDHGEIALPCQRWRAQGTGYRYRGGRGAPGGVREIAFGPTGLRIRAGGPGFTPIAGPVAYLEAWLTIAGERYLLRFHQFRRNDAQRVVTRRPSRAAARGEAAFWDTLWADRPREADALRLLEQAVRQDPRDGRSQFLLGMLHLYRAGEPPGDFDFGHLGAAAKAEGLAAQPHLDRAVALLPRDTRIAGFRAATTYSNGFVHADAGRTTLGLEELDAAVASNPLFNSFDVFAVVAPTIAGGSALYQSRVLGLADFVLKDSLACVTTLPETCTNAGMAPHNLEGTLILLADIYAKGGRPSDAAQWYTVARAFGQGSGYRYQAIADERVAHVTERVALYQDADPRNDPPLLGGGGAACVYCHNK